MARMIWRGMWIGGHAALLIATCAVAYRVAPWGGNPDQAVMALALLVAVLQAHAVLALVKEAFR